MCALFMSLTGPDYKRTVVIVKVICLVTGVWSIRSPMLTNSYLELTYVGPTA